jgi:ABC-type antimicrobial peptide transport system permease subunit
MSTRGESRAARLSISGSSLEQNLAQPLRFVKGGIGVVLGLIGAALLSSSMTTLLFNVEPTDPAVSAAVSIVLLAVALLASYLPARRASRIDPLIALRNE